MASRGGNNGGGGGGGRAAGAVMVPEGCRWMVNSLKEVVGGCPEAEIYAMLKECNMDPNEAVNRLLAQDPFHEVKSKREKKKENKSTTEPKTRGTNNNSSRGYGRSSGPQFSSSDSTQYGKPAYKKENISSVHASQLSVSSGRTGNNAYRQPPAHSNYVTADNKSTNTDSADGGWPSSVPSSGFSHPPSGNQPVWGGVPGQVSMADIVKRGRPQHDNKASSTTAANESWSYHDVNSSGVSLSKKSPEDEWPLVEPSTRIITPVVQPSSAWHTESSHLSSSNEIIDQHYPEEREQDEVPAVEEDDFVENNHDEYAYNNSEGASHFNNNNVYENVESYQPHDNAINYREVEDVGVSESSLTTNLQQLDIVDEREAHPEEDDAAVIIPNHLQVQNEDLLHLSFGSFGSLSTAPASSVPFTSRPTNSNTEEAREDVEAPSVGHLDTRNSEYYVEEPLRSASDGNLAHRTSANVATPYDTTSVSQSEALDQGNHEAPHENQYTFPSSSNYSFENAQQLNASFPPSHASAQMQQTFSDAYGNTLPSSLLAANAQARESDYSYSPFAMGSMPAKYGNTVPSVSSTSVSMPEVLKAAGLSSNIQTPQNLLGSNIATGPALPQQLMHQYSQIGQYANLIGYPFLPQSYYLPGAYQQAFAGNNAYHQSLLPQYKNSVSVSSLPQSAAVASGYGGSFGSSTSLPGGNFPTNQPSAPSAVGYEDVLSTQYKEANHLLSLQQAQNENQAMWVQGHGSRTMSGIPANTYYNYQAQNQQQQQQQSPAGFRQNQQQPTQNYGATLGNSNFYHSQSGMLLDHQQQQQQNNSRDGSLVASQVQANKQQSQQLWQNSY